MRHLFKRWALVGTASMLPVLVLGCHDDEFGAADVIDIILVVGDLVLAIIDAV